ncbi:hypothetical protein KEJ17_08570, partial [Candidatus Bathyarchaeota archaeon]|nr:hypothetical protein [Candidatus Bathyarchaeota archaeon]
AAIFAAFIFNMGWRMIIVGLEKLRMPKNFSFLLNLTIISIPLFLRESLKMLSAREARIMRKATLKGLWRILATITGDLLIKSYERSWKLEKSLIAR